MIAFMDMNVKGQPEPQLGGLLSLSQSLPDWGNVQSVVFHNNLVVLF